MGGCRKFDSKPGAPAFQPGPPWPSRFLHWAGPTAGSVQPPAPPDYRPRILFRRRAIKQQQLVVIIQNHPASIQHSLSTGRLAKLPSSTASWQSTSSARRKQHMADNRTCEASPNSNLWPLLVIQTARRERQVLRLCQASDGFPGVPGLEIRGHSAGIPRRNSQVASPSCTGTSRSGWQAAPRPQLAPRTK
jgi:hypothetical protein